MNIRLAVTSRRLFICILAVACCLPATESKPDEPGKSEKPAVDPINGRAPGEVRDDNGLKMKLVWCPPGKFTMGSRKSDQNRSDHEDQVYVTLTKGFYLGKTEVTQGEWRAVMRTTPWKGQVEVREGDNCAATCVSWDDVQVFCKKMNEKEKGMYRLPTEAEWEYACRAGTRTQFSFGDDQSHLDAHAWYNKNSWCIGEKYAHEVGLKRPNPFGLCDMHGNVSEWCEDAYSAKLPGGTDPLARGSTRVIRGGSWRWNAWDCRSASRVSTGPSFFNGNLGFRVAWSPTGNK